MDQGDDSDFEDGDDYGSKKKKNKTQAMPEPEETVFIPIGTKVFEKILDYRQNDETQEEELLVKYKVRRNETWMMMIMDF